MSREGTGAAVVGYVLSAMGLACALLGIFLEGVSVEIPGIAPERTLGGRGGAVHTLYGGPSFDLPGVFLES